MDKTFGELLLEEVEESYKHMKQRKKIKVHNEKSIYQQWEFNDLTQPSQNDNKASSLCRKQPPSLKRSSKPKKHTSSKPKKHASSKPKTAVASRYEKSSDHETKIKIINNFNRKSDLNMQIIKSNLKDAKNVRISKKLSVKFSESSNVHGNAIQKEVKEVAKSGQKCSVSEQLNSLVPKKCSVVMKRNKSFNLHRESSSSCENGQSLKVIPEFFDDKKNLRSINVSTKSKLSRKRKKSVNLRMESASHERNQLIDKIPDIFADDVPKKERFGKLTFISNPSKSKLSRKKVRKVKQPQTVIDSTKSLVRKGSEIHLEATTDSQIFEFNLADPEDKVPVISAKDACAKVVNEFDHVKEEMFRLGQKWAYHPLPRRMICEF